MNISSQQSVKRPEWVPGQRGFTLVELLLAVAIIAILSTLSVAMIASAQREARESATQGRINQIETILSTHIEDMEFRKLPFSTSDLEKFVETNPVPGVPRLAQVRNLRYRILADCMNAEMPRDWRSFQTLNDSSELFPSNVYPVDQAGLTFRQWLAKEYPNPASFSSPGPLPDPEIFDLEGFLAQDKMRPAMVDRWFYCVANARANGKFYDNQGELLYELLKAIDYDGQNGLESLGNGAIGDSDGDGLQEVVDSWGAPLEFAIVQVKAEDVGSDQWTDQPNQAGTTQVAVQNSQAPYYYRPSRSAYPLNHVGWDYLDPTIPRPFNQLRFDVWSNNVPRQVEF